MRRVVLFLFLFNPSGRGYFILSESKRGDYATCFVDSFNYRFKWISRFNMVEIGGVDNEIQREKLNKLREKGVKVLFYRGKL